VPAEGLAVEEAGSPIRIKELTRLAAAREMRAVAVAARRLLATTAATATAARASPTAAAAAATAARTNRARAALEVSDTAAHRIHELVARRRAAATGDPPPLGVRVGVRTRGCNGMSYTMDYAINPGKFDERVDIPDVESAPAGTGIGTGIGTGTGGAVRETLEDGAESPQLAVYIDPRALMHIIGTRMDYVDTDLASEFVFENPNAKGTCGCGESFNV
jgi:Fe-S cluster assembly iron-binding protein IscA